GSRDPGGSALPAAATAHPAPASCAAQPFEFLLRPHALQRVAARLVPRNDRAPRLGRLRQPAFPLEQECAHVEAADALGVELERAPPVGERALNVTQAGLGLATKLDQGRVVGRELEPGLR